MDIKTKQQIAHIDTTIIQKLTVATNQMSDIIHDRSVDYIRVAGLADEISNLAKKAHEIRETDGTV